MPATGAAGPLEPARTISHTKIPMDGPTEFPCETLAERYQALLEVAQAISTHRDLHELFRDLAQRLPRVVDVNFVSLSLYDPARNMMRLHTIQANVPADLVGGHEEPVEATPAGSVWQTQQPILVHDLAEERRWPHVTQRMNEDGTNSFCIIPLTTSLRRLGAIGFSSLKPGAYTEADLAFLQQIGNQVAVAVDNVLHQQDLAHDQGRLRLLLEVSESIALHRDLKTLFQDLAKRLPPVVQFEFIALILHDPVRNVMKTLTLGTASGESIEPGFEVPVEESAGGWVHSTQQPLVVPRRDDETRFPKITALLREVGVQSYCILPLTTSLRRLGAIGFGSPTPCAFGDSELEFLQQVATLVGVAVDNVLHDESAQSAQRQLARDRDRLQLLLDLNNAVVSRLEFRELFGAISTCLRKTIPHDYTSLALYEPDRDGFLVYALDFPGSKGFIKEGMRASLDTPAGEAFREGRAFVVAPGDLVRCQSDFGQRIAAEGLRAVCCTPLVSGERKLGTLNVARLSEDPFTPDDVELLEQVANQVAIAVDNALVHEQIRTLQEKLAKEKLYLEEEIQTEYNFEEIVGDSQALKRVLKEVQTVAATDSTVLILGETGSGKELVARALHNLSGRRERTFVKVNCAAIPTGLLESELFGHEKGAFTGAIATKIGRFELADHGTLFLDEVGEIPLDLQVKLLRVLQEQEFERLGSNRTIQVDVRMIAATNRDLLSMVEAQAFRSDLYYRLNVFPITVPPLRERAEDIPMLVRHFAQKFAQRMKKRIETIPSETMKALQSYPWPGNVRELENLVERAVILTQGSDLFVPLAELKRAPRNSTGSAVTLEQAEREHILKVLRDANWIIGGTSGAAAKLGMKRTTLQSKMQKLGISRPS